MGLLLGLLALPWREAHDLQRLADRCDWDCFLRLSHLHSVAPLLYVRLKEGPQSNWVPEQVMTALSKYHATTLARNVLLLSEAAAVCDRLHRHGIRVMLLKGIALLEDVYSHPALRPMGDIDILIHQQDLKATRRTLTSECGYVGLGPQSDLHEATHARATLAKADAPGHLGRLLLEAHWEIAPLDFKWKGRRPPTPEFWKGAQTIRLGRCEVWAPSGADHLCYVALHNCLHSFDKIISLVDTAYLLSKLTRPWRELSHRATEYRCGGELFLSIALVHALLGVPVDPDVLSKLAPARWRAGLLARLLTVDALFNERFSSTRRGVLRLLTADHIGDLLRLFLWSLSPCKAWRVGRTDPGIIAEQKGGKLSNLRLLADGVREALRIALKR